MSRRWSSTFESFGLMAGVAARSASQWLIVAVTAVQAGPAPVGQLASALAVTSPLFLFFDLGLRSVFITIHSKVRYGTYLQIRAFTTALALLLSLTASALPSSPPLSIVAALGVSRALDAFLDLAYASLHRRLRFRLISCSMIVHGALISGLFTMIFWATESLVLGLLGWALSSAIVIVWVSFSVLAHERRADLDIGTGGVSTVLRAGIRLGVAQSIAGLTVYLPTLLLTVRGSAVEVGLLATIVYFITAANLVLSSLQKLLLPRLAQMYAGDRRRFMRVLPRFIAWFVAVGLLTGVLTVVFGPDVLTIVYGREFAVGHAQLLPIGIALIFLPFTHFTDMLLLAANKYAFRLHTSLGAMILSASAAAFVWPDFRLDAAVWLIAISTAITASLGGMASWSILGHKVRWVRRPHS